MKKKTIPVLILSLLLLAAVFLAVGKAQKKSIGIIGGSDGPTAVFITESGGENMHTFQMITMAEAKEIFQTKGDYIILDVRRADEYASGHIPNAVHYANEDIVDQEPDVLPDKNQLIYVYCRSGNRSKQAAGKLTAMGYTNIVEFGGILDWTGEIVTE